MTFNPAFWKWFGKSKVVNSKRKPLVVYHGTDADFNTFEKTKGSVVTFISVEKVDRTGFFFTPNKKFAAAFSKSGRVLACYLSIRNPADFTTNEDFESFLEDLEDEGVNRRWILTGDMWEKFDGQEGKEFVDTLIDMGYDGAKIDEQNDDGKTVESWIAFHSHQIKTIDNDGTWDADDPDIRSNPEYSGNHGAPDKESGAPLWDVTLNGIYPKDFYSTMHQYHYGEANDDEAFYLISLKHNHPNSPVWVYRAIPSDVKATDINPGDWVTPVRSYAKEHGDDNLNGKYKIVKQKVYARDLFTSGDSVLEWGYDPQPLDRDALLQTRIRQWKKLDLSESDIDEMIKAWHERNK